MKNLFFLIVFLITIGCNPPLPEADVSITKNSDPTSPSGSASITVSTIAGFPITGIFGLPVDGTLGDARFGSSGDIVRDSAGNLFMSDTSSHVIRKITLAGVVTTFAGLASSDDSTAGFIDGTGTLARFYQPTGLTIDGSDNLYVADRLNNAIRKITPAGVVSTFVSTGLNGPFDIVFDRVGNLFITEAYQLKKHIPGSGVTVFAGTGQSGDTNGNGTSAMFGGLTGITIDPTNNELYVADTGYQSIRKITSEADVTTFFKGSVTWQYLVLKTFPLTLYVSGLNSIVQIDDNGNESPLAGNNNDSSTSDNVGANARFAYPTGLALDSVTGTLYIAQDGGVRLMNLSSGSVTSFVGNLGSLSTINGQGSSVRFNAPAQVAKDSQGNLFVAELFSHCIRKISPAGVFSTFAGLAGTSGTSDGNGAAARFNSPFGIVIDSSDNLYVVDAFNHAIRKITPTADVTTFAGLPGTPGYTDDTGTNARFTHPWALTIDASGNLFVADAGNSLIRKITPAGAVTTIAGSQGIYGHVDGPALTANLSMINGISISSSGDLFVTEQFDNGGGNLYYVRKITPGGDVTTMTDGTTLNDPRGIVVDSDGYLYVSDLENSLIRKISPTGTISTLLGAQGVSSSVDGNKSTARLVAPFGMSLYGNDIYFTEISGTIRKFNYT